MWHGGDTRLSFMVRVSLCSYWAILCYGSHTEL